MPASRSGAQSGETLRRARGEDAVDEDVVRDTSKRVFHGGCWEPEAARFSEERAKKEGASGVSGRLLHNSDDYTNTAFRIVAEKRICRACSQEVARGAQRGWKLVRAEQQQIWLRQEGGAEPTGRVTARHASPPSDPNLGARPRAYRSTAARSTRNRPRGLFLHRFHLFAEFVLPIPERLEFLLECVERGLFDSDGSLWSCRRLRSLLELRAIKQRLSICLLLLPSTKALPRVVSDRQERQASVRSASSTHLGVQGPLALFQLLQAVLGACDVFLNLRRHLVRHGSLRSKHFRFRHEVEHLQSRAWVISGADFGTARHDEDAPSDFARFRRGAASPSFPGARSRRPTASVSSTGRRRVVSRRIDIKRSSRVLTSRTSGLTFAPHACSPCEHASSAAQCEALGGAGYMD